MRRPLVLAVLIGAAVILLPWTIHLAGTLPDRHGSNQWRVAWVGFDGALLCCFAAAAWLGLRRRRSAVPVLAATAALLCCDAWFDVLLGWGSPDQWASLALAVLVELPLAMFLLAKATVLLIGDQPRRQWSVQDVELHTDEEYHRLLNGLGAQAWTTSATLATALALPEDRVITMLDRLAAAGYARRRWDGRWQSIGMTLLKPDLDLLPEADRHRLQAHLDRKLDADARLLTWAARHHERFGPWAKGMRSGIHLTEAELADFNDEYLELSGRYAVRHAQPADGTRLVAIRWYAFPQPDGTHQVAFVRADGREPR